MKRQDQITYAFNDDERHKKRRLHCKSYKGVQLRSKQNTRLEKSSWVLESFEDHDCKFWMTLHFATYYFGLFCQLYNVPVLYLTFKLWLSTDELLINHTWVPVPTADLLGLDIWTSTGYYYLQVNFEIYCALYIHKLSKEAFWLL